MTKEEKYNVRPTVRAYVECALWSSLDDNGEPLDQGRDISDCSDEFIAKAIADCERFEKAHSADVAVYLATVQVTDGSTAESYLGHDLWLSRNGHGAGFFDRDGVPKDVRRRLQDSVGHGTDFREIDPYVGDDGLIYS